MLIEIVGDKFGYELSVDDIASFKKTSLIYPKNRNMSPAYRDKSLKSIFAKGVPDSDKRNSTTIENCRVRTLTFLKWGIERGCFKQGIQKPISKTFSNKSGNKKRKDSRQIFDKKDLKALFESDQYIRGKHTTVARHFVPLLALFTGARLNELCQLRTSDIKFDADKNIHYIEINDEKDNKVKSQAALRDIPVHDELIRLGFIDSSGREADVREAPG